MKTCIVLLFVLCTSHLCAQQVISTCGASFSDGTKSIDWTLGEMVIETMETNSEIITHGLHQTRLEVSTSEDHFPQSDFIMVYPNPAHDFIYLHLTGKDLKGMKYALYNATGSLLLEGTIEEEIKKISFIPLPPAVYFIKMIKGEQLIHTFKIIKTN